MRMIYIPPIKMLQQAGNYGMQLMLPHLTRFQEYSEFYMSVSQKGGHVILDNGANEGVQASLNMEDLAVKADIYGVKELVLPDVMGNYGATVDLAREFTCKYIQTIPGWTKLGFVLHGHNAYDAMQNFELLMKHKVLYNLLDVIYIPRMLVTESDTYARIKVARVVHGFDKSKRIHFLGASPLWLEEVREVPSFVRSMDTSAPYVYAMKGAYVDEGKVYKRNHGAYFHEPIGIGTRKMAVENCHIMDSWCNV